jgi:hypothetical protein
MDRDNCSSTQYVRARGWRAAGSETSIDMHVHPATGLQQRRSGGCERANNRAWGMGKVQMRPNQRQMRPAKLQICRRWNEVQVRC